MNDGGEIVGMVDVLKLTYKTLEQINSMSTGSDSEGPAWNKFWLSLEDGTESIMSGEGGSHSHQHTNLGSRMMSPDVTRDRIGDSVAPGDSASHAGISPPHSAVAPITPELPPSEIPFPFKFKSPGGRVHRVQVIAAQGMAAFVENVTSKLGAGEVEAIGGAPTVDEGRLSGAGYALSYLDDEGDSVSITTDQDLLEAILCARQGGRDKVDLFVHDPEKPPVAAAPTPAPEPVVAPAATIRERKPYLAEDSDEEFSDESEARTRRKRSARNASPVQGGEQAIAGVPNELLLPGAIVALAVVIVGVFTISRMSSR